jgi:hypothetical protein
MCRICPYLSSPTSLHDCFQSLLHLVFCASPKTSLSATKASAIYLVVDFDSDGECLRVTRLSMLLTPMECSKVRHCTHIKYLAEHSKTMSFTELFFLTKLVLISRCRAPSIVVRQAGCTHATVTESSSVVYRSSRSSRWMLFWKDQLKNN